MLLNFKKILSDYKINSSGVIHIGAHYGHEVHKYVNANIKNILLFEPLSKNFRQLKLNVSQINYSKEDFDIILENCALGKEKGQVEMFVEEVNQGMSSSILEPAMHTEQYPHITFTKKEKVAVNTLDNYLQWRDYCCGGVADYDFINIDVQGYELEVFKGAVDSLNKIKYIMTEVNRAELYKNCAKVEELDSFLSEYGFRRDITSWDGDTWGDAFYVKS